MASIVALLLTNHVMRYSVSMKLISWNVNGIRAVHKKGAWDTFLKFSPDIFGIQETKAHPEQLSEELLTPNGYHSFFSSHETKKGYSGVGLYSKVEPKKVEHGIGVKEFDCEGRIVAGYFDDFVLFNVYFPNGGQGPERIEYKLNFYDAFLERIEKLRKDGNKIIFCGDVNTAHEEIDLARPKENEQNTGFLPEERAWIDEVVGAGYIDTFRNQHPSKKDAYSYWDLKSRARERNVGWRIDYFFVSSDLLPRLKRADIFADVYGSDHCPVMLELK